MMSRRLNDEERTFLRWLDNLQIVPAIRPEDPVHGVAESLVEQGWLRRVHFENDECCTYVLAGVAVSAVSPLQSDPPAFG